LGGKKQTANSKQRIAERCAVQRLFSSAIKAIEQAQTDKPELRAAEVEEVFTRS